MDGLNLGADWEQSKRLVSHWHKMWAAEKLKTEFLTAYYNPEDTSFRTMMDTFVELPPEKKDKLIDLARCLAGLALGGEG